MFGIGTQERWLRPEWAKKDCLKCHEGEQSKDPEDLKEEEKLARYAEAKQEIPWIRLFSLPDHTFFSHRMHVALAKIECAACHGPVEESTSLPAGPLVKVTMDWCTGCHAQKRADNDCLACHK